MMNRHPKRAVVRAIFLFAVGLLASSMTADAQNLRWGPFKMDLGFTTGFEFTDNVNSTEDNREADVKLTIGPTLSGGITLPFRFYGGEKLTIQTSVSYSYKISLTQENEETFSGPISVSGVIPIQLLNWRITAADGFTFRNDPLESLVALTEEEAEQYSNIATITATRNFGRVSLSLSGSRKDTFAPDVPDLEETQYVVSVTPAYFFRDNYSLFWRNSVGIVLPKSPGRQDSEGWSSEVGVSGQITPNLSGSISVGYAHTHLNEKKLGPGDGIFGGIFDQEILPADNIDGISSNVGVTYSNPLRPNTSYSISVFHTPGVTAVLNDSNVQQVTGATLGIAHRLNPRITLSPVFTWTHAEDAGSGGSGEITDLFAFGIGLSRRFGTRIGGSINYRFQTRFSNIEGSDYYVNRISANLNFSF